MADPRLERVGRQSALEAYLEGQVPVILAGAWWYWLSVLLSTPTASRSYSSLELTLLLSAGAGLAAWAASRVMYLFGGRRPAVFALAGVVVAVTAVWVLDRRTDDLYTEYCETTVRGALLPPSPLSVGPGVFVSTCVADASPDSPYLPGAILRRPWAGSSDLGLVTLLSILLLGATGGLAFRDRRIRRTRLGVLMIEAFAFGRGAGLAAVRGEEGDGKQIIMCDNPTLWGELCGQLYWDDAIDADKPCVRCGFNFHPGENVLVRTIGLTSDRVDQLNILESNYSPHEPWRQGSPARNPEHISLSARGVPRWENMGEFKLPRMITMAQALEILADRVSGGSAAGLTKARASRISAWVWFLPGGGRWLPNLAVQPGARYTLAAATERLGDVLDRHPGTPFLQLDIGLIPVQLRFGNRRRGAENLNQNLIVWVPMRSPHERGERAVSWVPRVETAALRTWLSVVRRSGKEEDRLDVDVMPYVWPDTRRAGRWRDGAGRWWELRSPSPEDPPEPLTFVRMGWDAEGEPQVSPRLGLLGARLDEWEWLEREQIEQLREGVVVAMPNRFEKRLVSRVQVTAEELGQRARADGGAA